MNTKTRKQKKERGRLRGNIRNAQEREREREREREGESERDRERWSGVTGWTWENEGGEETYWFKRDIDRHICAVRSGSGLTLAIWTVRFWTWPTFAIWTVRFWTKFSFGFSSAHQTQGENALSTKNSNWTVRFWTNMTFLWTPNLAVYLVQSLTVQSGPRFKFCCLNLSDTQNSVFREAHLKWAK